MKSRKAIITGMGIISALGNNRSETIKNIKSSKNTLKQIINIKNIDKLESSIAGQVKIKENSFTKSLDDKPEKMAYFAIKEALIDANLDLENISKSKSLIIYATCNGKALRLEEIYKNFENEINLLDQSKDKCYLSDKIKNKLKINWPQISVVSACAASNQALIMASNLIESFEYDRIIVCASDSLCETSLGGFNSLQSLSKNGCSPFSSEIGLSLGEAAGAMILENPKEAAKRKAKIYAEMSGSSFYGDAFTLTSPDPLGISKTMNEAILQSGIQKEKIQVICAHGTGTLSNDESESFAIKKCFQKNVNKVKVTSTKSFTGHTLGASGISQNIIMIDAMHQNIIPAIINFKAKRENCNLNYVKNNSLNYKYDCFLSNSLSFAGNNASIVFSKYPSQNKKILENKKIVITGYQTIIPNLENKGKIATPQIIKYENFLKEKIKENIEFRKHRKTPKNALFAIAAFQKIKENLENSVENYALFWNHCMGNLKTFEDTYLNILKEGIEYTSAINFSNTVFNSTAGHLASNFQIKGLQTTLWGQFAGIGSILYAKSLINLAKGKEFILGASEEISLYETKMISEKINNDKSINEGAAFIILEDEENAKNKKAKIYAEVIGIEINHDNLNQCIKNCLKKAQINKEEININFHSEFGLKTEKYFENNIYSQEIFGTMQSAGIFLNINLALEKFKNDKKINYISLTAKNLNNNSYCLILKRYSTIN